jgi:rSAM/selenodomain-associated transferase 2
VNISVIIPVLNEAGRIAETIERTRQLGACEIVVVDGGSSDGTIQHATAADRLISSDRGRGRQQNAGAAAARGDVLLFLHADCWLEPGALEAVCEALTDHRCIGGCFRQRIDADGFGFRALESGNALRVRTAGWAYGDQGIFLRRSVFEQVGGFPDVPLMEDLLLMKRLRGRGTFRLLRHRIHVSPRRWEQTGIVRQTLRNWTFVLLAHLGVSPARLVRHYANVR